MARLGGRSIAWVACLGVAFASALAIAGQARAGDRGLYVAFVDARGWGTADPRRDAFERAFFQCGEETLEACRASHVPGSAHDRDASPIYAMASVALDVALVEAARTSPRGRTELVDALNDRGVALDAVVMVRPEDDGRLTLVLINLNAPTVARLPLRRDGTLADGHRARAQRFLVRGWSP